MMSWIIRVGSVGLGSGKSVSATVTSAGSHTVAQLSCASNAGKTTSGKAGSIPACQTEHVWQNVLSTLVGV